MGPVGFLTTFLLFLKELIPEMGLAITQGACTNKFKKEKQNINRTGSSQWSKSFFTN
jgi:hypothetical protein